MPISIDSAISKCFCSRSCSFVNFAFVSLSCFICKLMDSLIEHKSLCLVSTCLFSWALFVWLVFFCRFQFSSIVTYTHTLPTYLVSLAFYIIHDQRDQLSGRDQLRDIIGLWTKQFLKFPFDIIYFQDQKNGQNYSPWHPVIVNHRWT